MNRLVSLLLLLLFAAIVRAESPPFKSYTTEEGLAHDNVNHIVRDSRGFLWFCTAEGLSRFDGTAFRNYTQDDGLPHRNVSDLLETGDGRYFVGTSNGLAVFNPDGRAYRWNVFESRPMIDAADPPLFTVFKPSPDDRQQNEITSLHRTETGVVWAGTDNGLFRFIEDGPAAAHFERAPIAGLENTIYAVHQFLKTRDGALLVATAAGIFRITDDGGFVLIDKTGALSMLEDNDGRLWLDSGTKTTGLRVVERRGDKLTPFKTYTKADGLPENAFYFAIRQTLDGRIFVGQHDGLSEFLPDAPAGEPKFRILRTEKVTSMTEDAGGNLWVGTEIKGAWKLARKGFTIFGVSDGIATGDDIRAIYETPAGRIVLPVRPKRSLFYEGGRFVGIEPRGLNKRSWWFKFLDLESADGEWWIPSETGLLRYPKISDPKLLAATTPKKIYTTADGLPGNEVFAIFEDSRGDIWFSIVGVPYSLLRWEHATERLIATGEADGLPKFNGPVSFAEDRNGSVWFGLYFGGLVRYHDGKFRYFTAADGIPESAIIDLLVDDDGRLWIATSGQGLFRIDDTSAEVPRFENISTIDGLSSNHLICLTKDRFGRIYAGTGRGISRLVRDGGIRIFSQADGLPSNYITRCAADSKGNLWFVSQNTLLRFSPEVIPPDVPPTALIDRILVNGVAQKISELGAANVGELALAHDQSQIQIGFFALSFGAEGNIRYQYRLDDQDWSAPSAQQKIDLNLADGRHRFEVRAIRGDNVTSVVPAAAVIDIRPPLWARWWFMLLTAFLLTAAVSGLYRFRTQKLREVNAALMDAKKAEENLRRAKEDRLAELERVRSRIATDLHDDIGASLTQIAVLSEVAQARNKNADNGSAEPLQRISTVSNELVEAMSDIVWAINPAKDQLSDLTQRMRRFASDVLSAKGITVQFTTRGADGETIVETNVRREVFMLFKETVNNLAKHSSATHATIAVEVANGRLALEIADNGRGIAASPTDGYGGNGIPNMRRRASELGGDFAVETSPETGTKVMFSLPLGRG